MSLTYAEAQARSAALSVDKYVIKTDFTTGEETFQCHTTVTFSAKEDGTSTFIDLVGAKSVKATLNGKDVDTSTYNGKRIELPSVAKDNTLVVEAELPYASDADGMFRYVDPTDDAVYVCGFAGMDVACRMFACFDQPDLKAALELTAVTPKGWSVRANGEAASEPVSTDATTTHTFVPTKPISTYLFVVCAGPWASYVWEYAGREFGWHAKKSLAPQLERDVDELRRITEGSYDYYTSVFDEDYAFGHYHQIFAPGLNWGALETPGCVTFRDEFLPIDEPTFAEELNRATVIAHEMAHMWFGDLVTMQWWDDTWLNESFADFMSYHVCADALGYEMSWTNFSLSRKSRAYAADSRRSTHPVAPGEGAITDVDIAFTFFDMISYSKGTSVLRQLVEWLGKEPFFKGLNTYLTKHAFGNATLDDLITALDAATDRDVRGWAGGWLFESGFDVIKMAPVDGGYELSAGGDRPHVMDVARLVRNRREIVEASTDHIMLPVSGTAFVPAEADEFVVPNCTDTTFARIQMVPAHIRDIASDIWRIEKVTTRAAIWWSYYAAVAAHEMSLDSFVDAAAANFSHEQEPIILNHMSSLIHSLIAQRLDSKEYLEAASSLSEALATRLSQPAHARSMVAARAALTMSTDVEALQRAVTSKRTFHGIETTMDLRWIAIKRLAELGQTDEAAIDKLQEQDPTSRGKHRAIEARAALPGEEFKKAALDVVLPRDGKAPNSRHAAAALAGLWSPAQPLDSLLPYIKEYIERTPKVAAASQGIALVLGSHFPQCAARQDMVDMLSAAVEADSCPSTLKRYWNDAVDTLSGAIPPR